MKYLPNSLFMFDDRNIERFLQWYYLFKEVVHTHFIAPGIKIKLTSFVVLNSFWDQICFAVDNQLSVIELVWSIFSAL